MKPCLVDVNLVLALLIPRHQHHRIALRWFDELIAGQAGLCRFAQLAVVRLLANRTVMGDYAMPAVDGWLLVDQLLQDERIEFVPEPSVIDSLLPVMLQWKVPSGKLVGDAYLAAFALASARCLVTIDAGFRSLRAVDVRLIR
jgi:hypothetical protein